jgi:hypothetical protein
MQLRGDLVAQRLASDPLGPVKSQPSQAESSDRLGFDALGAGR